LLRGNTGGDLNCGGAKGERRSQKNEREADHGERRAPTLKAGGRISIYNDPTVGSNGERGGGRSYKHLEQREQRYKPKVTLFY